MTNSDNAHVGVVTREERTRRACDHVDARICHFSSLFVSSDGFDESRVFQGVSQISWGAPHETRAQGTPAVGVPDPTFWPRPLQKPKGNRTKSGESGGGGSGGVTWDRFLTLSFAFLELFGQKGGCHFCHAGSISVDSRTRLAWLKAAPHPGDTFWIICSGILDSH